VIRLTIRRKLPSANLWTNKQGRAARSIYRKERNEWHILMRSGLTPRHPDQVKVSCRIISYRTHLLDFANLVAGAKPIPDILKTLGYIYDDAPRYFSCVYEQHQCPAAQVRTVIDIGTT
jgi:hypothetical protein